VGAYMITFSPIFKSQDLILKSVPQLAKTCAICLKPADSFLAVSCADCLYPYDNQQFFSAFDYFEYLQYSAVSSIKAHDFFIKTAVLNPCAFCGADAVLQDKSFSIYERYYPAFEKEPVKYKDTLRTEVFYLGCTGCIFETEYLFLYQFYAFYQYLIEAWNDGKSRLPLIKYSDLRLPDWSMNYQLLKTIKKYAVDYQEKFNPQQSLFPDLPPVTEPLTKRQRAAIALQNMHSLYARY
jgi:hypothetical protein